MQETASGGKPADKKTGHDVSVEPGQTCPTCERRVPHPRKPSSPETAVISYRVPIDEVAAHKDTQDAAAHYIGTAGRPHEVFWTYVYALAHVLQDPEMQGIAQRFHEGRISPNTEYPAVGNVNTEAAA